MELLVKPEMLTSYIYGAAPTSVSDSPPRLTYPKNFSRLSTAILTFLAAAEPNLQRHPYTTTIFGLLSSSNPP